MIKHEVQIKITALNGASLATVQKAVLDTIGEEAESVSTVIKFKIEDGDGVDVETLIDRIERKLAQARAVESEVTHKTVKAIAATGEAFITTPMGRAAAEFAATGATITRGRNDHHHSIIRPIQVPSLGNGVTLQVGATLDDLADAPTDEPTHE